MESLKGEKKLLLSFPLTHSYGHEIVFGASNTRKSFCTKLMQLDLECATGNHNRWRQSDNPSSREMCRPTNGPKWGSFLTNTLTPCHLVPGGVTIGEGSCDVAATRSQGGMMVGSLRSCHSTPIHCGNELFSGSKPEGKMSYNDMLS